MLIGIYSLERTEFPYIILVPNIFNEDNEGKKCFWFLD